MTRNEARNKVIDLLLGDNNANADFYANLFENYNYGDVEMTPISPMKMGDVNQKNNVVITTEAYLELVEIRNITNRTNQEVAYLILGEEKPNGTVWLDTVVSSYRPSSKTSASFDSINSTLNEYVREIEAGEYANGNKQIICHGHTHGISPVSDNFSFGDLISYIEFANMHPLFKNRQVETIGMVMPPSGDFNFIMYENNPSYEGFYKFPTIYLRHSNGAAELLPAYQNGNYLVDMNTSKNR